MRSGWKSTEFWVGLSVTIGTLVQQKLWPESPFPAEALTAVGLWIAARIGEKTLGPADTGEKRAWQTSEFWFAIGFGVVKFLFPSIPAGIEQLVFTYIIGRPIVKVTKSLGLLGLLTGKK